MGLFFPEKSRTKKVKSHRINSVLYRVVTVTGLARQPYVSRARKCTGCLGTWQHNDPTLARTHCHERGCPNVSSTCASGRMLTAQLMAVRECEPSTKVASIRLDRARPTIGARWQHCSHTIYRAGRAPTFTHRPGALSRILEAEYLAAYGIRTATTCFRGLCTARSNPLLLPRLVDTMTMSDLEFCSWLTGTASLLPKRAEAMSEGQLGEDN